MNVSIVNYGTGNLKSVYKGLLTAAELIKSNNNIKIKVTSNPRDILNADKVILPGQGSYKQCFDSIKNISGLKESLDEFVLIYKKPIFGICVGMQLFSTYGYEEKKTQGFNWIKGVVKKLKIKKKFKLPHIGWNDIKISKKNLPLKNIKNFSHFYFVHSFFFDVDDKKFVTSLVNYDLNFTSSVEKDNIFGTQFHPEKSQKKGIIILKNFLKIDF